MRGVHDFASFCFKPREDDDTVRSLEVDVELANDMTFADENSSPVEVYHLHFRSRAFLHNQVSNLASLYKGLS